MFTDPVAGLDVIRVRILGKASGFGLLGGEEALLGFSDLEQPVLGISMACSHTQYYKLNDPLCKSPKCACRLECEQADSENADTG